MNVTVQLVRQAREKLLVREGALAKKLFAHYTRVEAQLEARIALIGKQYGDAIENGDRPDKFLSQSIMISLLAQVKEIIEKASDKTSSMTITAEKANMRHALRDYEKAIAITSGMPFHQVPFETVEVMAGFLADGTSLYDHLAKWGEEAREKTGQILTEGITYGTSVHTVAQQLRSAVPEMTTWNAIATARTESMRAYRQASQESMLYNSNVVTEWMWFCNFSDRTCAACLGLHGTMHPLSEPFGSHVCCRCVPMPVISGTMSVDVGGTGDEWLQKQSAETQDKVLGKSKGKLYRDGTITVTDLVDRQPSKWGPTARVKTLNDLVNEGRITEKQKQNALLNG